MKVRVLYEDQLVPNGTPANYAPHKLMLKCLYDKSEISEKFPQYQLEKLVLPIACKGNSNVQKQLEKNQKGYVDAQIAPVCCLDSDRIQELLGLPKVACKSEIKAKHWQGHSFAHKALVLLERNLEDVLRKAQENGANFTSAEMEVACRRKNLDARDILILRVANNSELREQLMSNMPSLKYLVDSVARLALLP